MNFWRVFKQTRFPLYVRPALHRCVSPSPDRPESFWLLWHKSVLPIWRLSLLCFSSNARTPALLPNTHIEGSQMNSWQKAGLSFCHHCFLLLAILLPHFPGTVKSEKINKGRMTEPYHIWFAHYTTLSLLPDTFSISQNELPGLDTSLKVPYSHFCWPHTQFIWRSTLRQLHKMSNHQAAQTTDQVLSEAVSGP